MATTIMVPRVWGGTLILTVTPLPPAPSINVTWVTRDNITAWKTRDGATTWQTRDGNVTWKGRQ